MAENKYGQTRHTSIIKGSDDENASSDSDDVFDDDDEEEDAHQVLKTDSDESKKTITSTQSQPTSINSSNNPDDKFVNPDGQCRSLHDQRDNRRPALYFRPPLPNSGSQANNKRLEASNMSPSHSLRDLLYSHPNSLQKQLTDDSGHGDSLENLAARVSADESGHFTPVEVYGQPGVVILMKNRFDFDPAKLEEHRKKKKKTLSIRSPKQKPPVIEKSPKLSGILARLSRSSKASVDDSSAFPSVFRHHSSMTDPKDNV